MTTIIIVSGTSQVSPADWDNAANTVEGIGAGGGGTRGSSGASGGGGEYRKIANFSVATPGTTAFNYVIGAGGTGSTTAVNGGTGTNTTFNTSSLIAVGGGGGTTGFVGGAGGTGGTGAAANNNGGAGSTAAGSGGAGGGGAGGPNGVGATGGGATAFVGNEGGNGGGGNGGGSAGANVTNTTTGANGGNNSSATGGGTGAGTGGTTATAGANGSAGGGGQGGGEINVNNNNLAGQGGTGGTGTEFDSTHGSGGGGGGGGSSVGNPGRGGRGGDGGLYGGGGGGGGGCLGTDGNGGNGANGIIFITYTPTGGASAPFVQPDLGPTHDVRWMLPRDLSRSLNPNLQKNPVPFNQFDWAKPCRVPHITPDASRSLNPNLQKNPVPNNQTDWLKPRRIDGRPLDLSVPLNPNLQKNNVPVLNATGTKPLDLLGPPTPPQPYNSALYAVAAARPVMQTDQPRAASPPDFAPPPPQPLNLNLFGAPACGLVGIDQIGTALVGGVSVTTIDYTGVTVGDGPNRALVAMASISANTTGLAAVWDQGGTNQAMTLIGSVFGAGQTVALFGLRNPVGGNKTLRFSWTTAGIPTVEAVALVTVDQSSDANAFQSYRSDLGIGVASASVTVPSESGDLVVGCANVAGGPTVVSVGDNSLYIDNTSAGVFSGAGWSAGAASVTFTATPSAAADVTLAAISVSAFPCTVSLPFSQFESGRPRPLLSAPIDSSGPDGLNINLFTNPVPFNQVYWPSSFFPRAFGQPPRGFNPNLDPKPFINQTPALSLQRSLPDDVAQPYNLNLYAVVAPSPLNQTDWSRPFFPRGLEPNADSLNINLFTNQMPFSQFDWSKPQQIRLTQPQPQSGLNINLFTNPVPVANLASAAPFAVQAQPAPDQAYNLNLYGVAVVALPFNQFDFAKPFFPRALPLPPDSLNINLLTNPVPFDQTDWSRPPNRFTQPFPQAGLNINLFTNPVPFGAADITAHRLASLALPDQPYNAALYTVTVAAQPFTQPDPPLLRRPLAAAVLSDPLNINLFRNDMPVGNVDPSTPMRLRAAIAPGQPLNLNLFGVFVPLNQFDFAVTTRPRPTTAPVSAFNPNLQTNPLPFSQFDYPPAHRVPAAPLDLSRGQPNPNIFTNPMPFLQADVGIVRSLRGGRPFDAINVALLGTPVTIVPLPFNQYDWAPARKQQPQRQQDQLNPTLIASFVPPPPDAEQHSKPFFATPGRLMNI